MTASGDAKAVARARKQRRKLLVACAQLSFAAGAAAAASSLLALRVPLPADVNLPFGLYTTAVVSALLSGDALLGAWRRGFGAPPDAAPLVPHRTWHDAPLPAVLAELRCSAKASGLTAEEAAARLTTHGRNVLAAPPPSVNVFIKLLDEVHEPQQLLLLVVACLFAFVGEVAEAALALSVIALMCLAETWTEARAKAAMRSLGTSAPALAAVLRDGEAVMVDRATLVPGDVVLLRAGHEVPADARLLDARGLACDESRLTGESVPVGKHAARGELLPAATPLAERANVVHAGTVVTRGAGTAVVCATGGATELGAVLHAAKASASSRQAPTPMQALLRKLAGTLSVVALLASVLGGLLGLVKQMKWQDVVLCGLSLAFATIPEELPILTAAVLALGARALSARGIYAKRMRALESLACVDVVLIDKTGTLTNGSFRLARVLLPDVAADVALSEQQAAPPSQLAGVLDAWRHTADDVRFDPFDAAVEAAFADAPAVVTAPAGAVSTAASLPEDQLMLCGEAQFDVAARLSARSYTHTPSGARLTYIKGAPDALLPLCTQAAACAAHGGTLTLQPLTADAAAGLAERVAAASAAGLRTLAFARAVELNAVKASPAAAGDVADLDLAQCSSMALALLGVFCFEDPPRAEAAAAVAACHAAGIHVAIVSGDHTATAEAIARHVGILPAQGGAAAIHCGIAEADSAPAEPVADDAPPAWAVEAARTRAPVLARAAPSHKLALVRAYAAKGHTVLVTGDGANDAPALAAASVGLAAAAATDIARDAAAVVVLAGDLSSVAIAVAEGRRLFDNLNNALAFYLGAKAGLVAVFIVATLWFGFPLQAVSIIVLELYMDLGASLSFCSEPAEPHAMARPPRAADARFFDAAMLARIAAGGISMLACVLGGFAWGLHGSRLPHGDDDAALRLHQASSMSFVCWLIGHILLALNQSTGWHTPALSKRLTANRVFLGWALATALLCVLVGTTGLDAALALRRLGARDWGVAVGVCAGGTFWIEALKWGLLLRSKRRKHYSSSMV